MFYPATVLSQSDVAIVQSLVRRRVLRLFEHNGLLSPEAAENMRQWRHGGGFSLDASVAVEATDRAGLERVLRYCARPAYSVERLSWCAENERVVYRLPKPGPDGTQRVEFAVSELFDRLAALIPPPRRHRHRYHEVVDFAHRTERIIVDRLGFRAAQTSSKPLERPAGRLEFLSSILHPRINRSEEEAMETEMGKKRKRRRRRRKKKDAR